MQNPDYLDFDHNMYPLKVDQTWCLHCEIRLLSSQYHDQPNQMQQIVHICTGVHGTVHQSREGMISDIADEGQYLVCKMWQNMLQTF